MCRTPKRIGYAQSCFSVVPGGFVQVGQSGHVAGWSPLPVSEPFTVQDDDGPPPIRGRDGMTRFGLPIISWANKQLCDQDSLLWLRLLWFCYIGRQANVDMEIGIEQPSDPEEFLPETRLRPQYGFPSFLSWPETFTIIETCSLTRIRFDQGALGHPHKKPTEMLSSIPEVHALDGMRITLGQEMERWSEDLGDRLQQAKAAAAWARGLVAILQIAIRRKQDEVSTSGQEGSTTRNKNSWVTGSSGRKLRAYRSCGKIFIST